MTIVRPSSARRGLRFLGSGLPWVSLRPISRRGFCPSGYGNPLHAMPVFAFGAIGWTWFHPLVRVPVDSTGFLLGPTLAWVVSIEGTVLFQERGFLSSRTLIRNVWCEDVCLGGEERSQCRTIKFIPFGSGSIPDPFPLQTRWGSGLDRWVSPGSIRFRRGRGKKGGQPPARVVEHISWSRAREKRRCSRHRSTSANADAEGDANERK